MSDTTAVDMSPMPSATASKPTVSTVRISASAAAAIARLKAENRFTSSASPSRCAPSASSGVGAMVPSTPVRPGCGPGSFRSLRRVYNWRVSMLPYKERADEMERLRREAKSADVKRYYRDQLHQIEQFITLDELQRKSSVHPNDERPDGVAENDAAVSDDSPLVVEHDVIEVPVVDSEEDNSMIAWVTRGSLALNILLFFMKIALVVRSGSMAFVASLVDSALDLFSGAVMVAVSYLISHSKEYNFPTGKHKFEAIGTLIFACAMFIAATKVIEECINTLVDIDNVKLTMEPIDYFFIGFVIVSKGIAHVLCNRCAAVSPTIEALADDHRNDVLTNGCAVLAVFGARHFSKYIDPAIGMATALFMMYNWAGTAYEQATALSGAVAEPQFLNTLTMIARNHDPRVLAVDTVRAVTSGSGHMVEIDLLLPEDMTLVETHDIGERLQVFLENCDALEITRAYVHLDYETDHKPSEHR